MTAIDIPALSRPAFFDGQRLDPADMYAIAEHQRRLRWLHNEWLHGWGIVTGLTVTAARGARDVRVTPGYALDTSGRELLLPSVEILQVPPVVGPEEYYLTLSYVDDADLAASETREGVCAPVGAVRRPERARLRWQSPTEVLDAAKRFRPRLDIVLAAVSIRDCSLDALPDLTLRRELTPTDRPYIAAGITKAAATHWQYFPSLATKHGVATIVDTSAAGFRHTPEYTAQIVGERAVGGNVFDGIVSIAQPTATSFVCRLTMPMNLLVGGPVLNSAGQFNAALLDTLRNQLQWQVSWMGVET